MINAYELHTVAQNAELFELDTDHVFGRRHPWTEDHLPDATRQVVDKTIQFFSSLKQN
jgi:hypothetical protein